MLWHGTVNQWEIGNSPVPLSVSQDAISFNGFGLQNAKYRSAISNHDDLGRVDLSSFDFPMGDGGGVLSKFFRGRPIGIRVSISAATPEELNDAIDDLKKNLSGTEGNLDITVNGEIRRIRATLTGAKFDRKHYNLTFVSCDLTFTATEAFFRAVNDQSWLFESRGTDFWEEIGHGGSAYADPKFYFIVGAGSSATGITVTCRSRSISVSGTFAAGDVVSIDCDEKTAKHNGTEIDYSGMFPKFQTGSNPFHTVVTGSGTVDLTVIAAKNYL